MCDGIAEYEVTECEFAERDCFFVFLFFCFVFSFFFFGLIVVVFYEIAYFFFFFDLFNLFLFTDLI